MFTMFSKVFTYKDLFQLASLNLFLTSLFLIHSSQLVCMLLFENYKKG